MIGRIYRLIDTKRFEMKLRELRLTADSVLVKSEYMSICAADQRYYMGRRRPKILKQKLPMALIHEATGVVLKDFKGIFSQGERVILMPLETGWEANSEVKGNYRPDSRFASSGEDGFMRDIVAIPHNRLIRIDGKYHISYVLTEPVSVALGAIAAFEASRRTSADVLGIWGDGSMGYVMALILRYKYPKSKIFVFGKTARKLQKFSFATRTFLIDQLPSDITVSHAFECVGDSGSEDAIEQIVGTILPQGIISLLGVSEEPVSINTRSVLDKGLQLIGNSRSDAKDFKEAAELIHDSEPCRKYLQMLISETIDVKSEADIIRAFEQDVLNDFKTVMKWSL